METTTHSPRVYWKTCAALMALLAVTWSIGYVNLGSFNLVVALAISISKALLVALFFMHLKFEGKLIFLILLVPVFLSIVLVISLIPDVVHGLPFNNMTPFPGPMQGH